MSSSIDLILTVGSVIIGIMLLTGHGDVFMKGGNAEMRKKTYDEEKMAKASGAALVLIGIATGIDSVTTGLPAKIAYIVVLLIILGVLLFYMRTKCRK